MTPREEALDIISEIMFNTSMVHLDDVVAVAIVMVKRIKLNCLDDANKHWNEVIKELEKM